MTFVGHSYSAIGKRPFVFLCNNVVKTVASRGFVSVFVSFARSVNYEKRHFLLKIDKMCRFAEFSLQQIEAISQPVRKNSRTPYLPNTDRSDRHITTPHSGARFPQDVPTHVMTFFRQESGSRGRDYSYSLHQWSTLKIFRYNRKHHTRDKMTKLAKNIDLMNHVLSIPANRYDKIDGEIDRMNRSALTELNLTCLVGGSLHYITWGKILCNSVVLNAYINPIVCKNQLYPVKGIGPFRNKIYIAANRYVKIVIYTNFSLNYGITIQMVKITNSEGSQESRQREYDGEIDRMNRSVADMRAKLKYNCYVEAILYNALKFFYKVVKILVNFTLAKNVISGGESSASGNSGSLLTVSIQDTYRNMDNGNTAIPLVLVNLFRTTFPRFAEQGEQGMYMQQDASECWTELMRLLQDELPAKEPEKTLKNYSSNLISQYFTGQFQCEWKCVESETEGVTNSTDDFKQLSCHISQDVKYLHTGLKARLQEQITKKSTTLDRDAVYTKKSLISRLPAYLPVEMVRFFYKEKEGVNAKILKDVKFPMVLDVFDFCTKELQDRLLPNRIRYKEMDERIAEEEKEAKRNMKVVEKPKLKRFPYSFDDDLGSNKSGFYELQAVLTHQGRSSSSGHYVGWVKWRGKEWLKCDDDNITAVSEEEILKLSGGGDWHCAYILLYGPRVLELVEEEEPKMETDAAKAEEKMET
ncbi:unnamed protein product, partial [Meganyctiphanes norvegica]